MCFAVAKETPKKPSEKDIIAAIEDAIATKSYSSIYKDSAQMFTALKQAVYIGDNSSYDKIKEQYPWRYDNNHFFQIWIIATSKSKGFRLRIFKPMKVDSKKIYFCISNLGSHKESYYQLTIKMQNKAQ